MVLQFNFPTPIQFGNNAIDGLAQTIKATGLSKPLIVTDSTISGLGFMESKLFTPLKSAGVEHALFDGFSGNPVKSHVEGGVSSFHDHQCDSLVIVGGGAALDVGKAIALMAFHPGDLFDYEDGKVDGRPADQKFPHMIAVPTTAGTGSEVGRSSVISDDETKAKKIIFAPQMLPNLVIADPTLTVDLPAGVTAATGIDALTHLLEAYLAKGFHPMCDGIALEGIRLVASSLVDVVRNPFNLESRGHMLIASLMGAVAFQKGLGVNHSCAHALSTIYDTHHGLANGLMLKACMAFNYEAVPKRFANLAQALGLRNAEEFLTWIDTLLKEVDIPLGLSNHQIEVTEELLTVAENDICHPSNPRPVSREDFRNLFQASL